MTISGFPVREIRGPLASSRLDKVIADWAEANAYQPSQHRDWRVSEGDKTIGQVRFLELRPLSSFDGLHIDLGGPIERPLPELNIKCVSTDDPAETFVSVDAGFITKDTREESAWPAVLDSLEAAIQTGAPEADGIDRARAIFQASNWLSASAYGGILFIFLVGPGIVRYTSIRDSNTLPERRLFFKQAAIVLALALLLGVLPTAMALHGVITLQATLAAVLLLFAALLATAIWFDWQAARHPTHSDAVDSTDVVSGQGIGEQRNRASTSGPLVTGVFQQAFQEWWTGRDNWFANSVKASLLSVYVACVVTFFYFHGLWTAHEWKGELGLPSPWFVSHNKPGSFYTSELQLSSSWLVAGIGLLAYYGYCRIKMAEKRSISVYMTPAAHIIYWCLLAVLAVLLCMISVIAMEMLTPSRWA